MLTLNFRAVIKHRLLEHLKLPNAPIHVGSNRLVFLLSSTMVYIVKRVGVELGCLKHQSKLTFCLIIFHPTQNSDMYLYDCISYQIYYFNTKMTLQLDSKLAHSVYVTFGWLARIYCWIY